MESKNTVVTDKNPFSLNVRIARMLWSVVWCLFAKPFPRGMMMGWKRFLLRCFGVDVHGRLNVGVSHDLLNNL